MFKLKLKQKKNYFPNLKKRIKKLEKEKVFIGWTKSMGLHDKSKYPYESKDPLTYTQLAAIMEYGQRHVGMRGFFFRDKMLALNPPESNDKMKSSFHKYFSNIHLKAPKIKVQAVLECIGGEYVENFRNILGNRSHLRPLKPSTITYKSAIGTPSPNSPIAGFGSFEKATSYKINGVLVNP